jgi:ABC-type uncharacterized transport system
MAMTRDASSAVDSPSAARRARLVTGLQVAATVLLFTAAVLLVCWLGERPGLRVRLDLTAGRQNTLDASTSTVLERLPGEVDVDVFFRSAEFPFQQLAREVQDRTRRLLVLLADNAPGRVRVAEHDVSERSDRTGGVSRAEERMRELGLGAVEPGGVVVVSLGARRAVLHLRGDLADLDPGDPLGRSGPPQPPVLVSFRAEESLTSALLKVSQGDAPKVVFAAGHDELSIAGTDTRGLSSLKRDLENDGFRVESWQGERDGAIASDANILAIIGPQRPFTSTEVSAIEAFVESGGRLIAAPGGRFVTGEGSFPDLLERWGIRVSMNGLIARPWPQPAGPPLQGVPECAQIFVWSEGMRPGVITDPLRRADRRVVLPFTRSLERGEIPRGATLVDLLVTLDDTWRDLPDPKDPNRFNLLYESTEERGPFTLAMQEAFPPSRPPRGGDAPQTGARPECRIVCFGSSEAFSNRYFEENRDLLLNAFNWTAAREFRVNVSRKSHAARRLDVTKSNALSIVNAVAVFVIPGVCLVLGFWTAMRRRR